MNTHIIDSSTSFATLERAHLTRRAPIVLDGTRTLAKLGEASFCMKKKCLEIQLSTIVGWGTSPILRVLR